MNRNRYLEMVPSPPLAAIMVVRHGLRGTGRGVHVRRILWPLSPVRACFPPRPFCGSLGRVSCQQQHGYRAERPGDAAAEFRLGVHQADHSQEEEEAANAPFHPTDADYERKENVHSRV